jgi:hypothetical protein
MARKPPEEDYQDWMYPNNPPCIQSIAITKQTLNGCELKCEIQAVTNVPNLAVLTPSAWTKALFDLLLQMHGGVYEDFRDSCTDAVHEIKLGLSGNSITDRIGAH